MVKNAFARPLHVAALGIASVVALAACDAHDADVADRSSENDEIVAGKSATKYPEAVLVDMLRDGVPVALCSGALVAPRVVLTAGHCVHGWDGWRVRAPFADGQTAVGDDGVTYDWKNESMVVDPREHDLGLVFLSTPITLASYPTLATAHVPFGSKVVNIGRIHDGEPSFTKLFLGRAVSAVDGKNYGFPFSYASTDVIESGDSGGPVVRPSTHEIVAVNSGGGNGLEILARVDLLAPWIADEIASHGGAGASPATGCGSLDYAGTCTGDVVRWCEASAPQVTDCKKKGKRCGYDELHQYYNCL